MWNIMLRNMQFRARQLLIAVVGTALVFARGAQLAPAGPDSQRRCARASFLRTTRASPSSPRSAFLR
jgi:hypothetical protein